MQSIVDRPIRKLARTGFWASLAVLAACSSDGSDAAKNGSPSDSTTAATRSLVGNFQINLRDADPELGTPAFSALIGSVYDKKAPAALVLKLARSLGGCDLLVPANPFCETPCAPGVCTADNECTPAAVPQNVGTVRVQGLGASMLTITAPAPAYSYQPSASESLPNPPCAEGAEVRLDADDFSITARCITPLVLTTPKPLPVRKGQPVHVTWTPPGDPSIARVHIKLDIAHHGGKKGELVCDVPDTGSFDIPEPLVSDLVALGVAGFPTIVVSRDAEGAANNAPSVKLTLSSSTERSVDTGVESCTDSSECAGGKSCADDLTCR